MKNGKKSAITSSEELEFAIFCIEHVALKLNTDAVKIYSALTEKSDLLYRYVVSEYETLHTQSKDYIVDDIIEVMQEEGIAV